MFLNLMETVSGSQGSLFSCHFCLSPGGSPWRRGLPACLSCLQRQVQRRHPESSLENRCDDSHHFSTSERVEEIQETVLQIKTHISLQTSAELSAVPAERIGEGRAEKEMGAQSQGPRRIRRSSGRSSGRERITDQRPESTLTFSGDKCHTGNASLFI